MSRSGFYGTWRNTDVTSESVVALAFEAEQERVHAWSGRPEARIELGSGPIETFGGIADPAALAFTARLPGAGAGEVLLQGNLNRGLMILATYHWDSGEAGLAGRFSREFLARRDPVPRFAAGLASPASLPAPTASTTDPDPHEFVGHWLNASEQGDLHSLTIETAGSRLSLSVRGAGRRLPAVWPTGETWLFGYHDEAGHDTLLVLGRFELPEGRSDLQIKVANGTAVVASFHARNDARGSCRSWFTREFLRRV